MGHDFRRDCGLLHNGPVRGQISKKGNQPPPGPIGIACIVDNLMVKDPDFRDIVLHLFPSDRQGIEMDQSTSRQLFHHSVNASGPMKVFHVVGACGRH